MSLGQILGFTNQTEIHTFAVERGSDHETAHDYPTASDPPSWWALRVGRTEARMKPPCSRTERICMNTVQNASGTMANIAKLEEIARQTRRDALRMVHSVASGHPGGALDCADYLVALYFDAMKYTPSPFNVGGDGEDMFFLSNGHVSAAWYSVLARAGYFTVHELGTFRRLGSRLQGHPTAAEGLPGVRIASGSLGQGLSVACGAALAKRMRGDEHWVYSLHGDGELQEGQIWEAALFAAAKGLDRLIAAVDCNNAQIDGPVDQVMPLGPLEDKWRSFGWTVLHCQGHSMLDLVTTLQKARGLAGGGKPIALLLDTSMGHGVDFMEGDYRWHGKAPNDEQLANALKQLPPTSLGDY